jgi:hypothetical protein
MACRENWRVGTPRHHYGRASHCLLWITFHIINKNQ